MNKIDLLPYLKFDTEAYTELIKDINKNVAYDKYWNMYKRVEDGAVIYHTGKESPLEKGQKAIMTATVAKHLISKKGDRVTIVKIPKFKDISGD